MKVNQKKIVSAIVPAYKTEPYLDTFLTSVCNQTILSEIEIVLDLNLPSKTELEIVREHKRFLGDSLKVSVSKELNSISASMNQAILNSSGRYIAIWNVDDLRTPFSLESQLEILLSDSNITCAIGPYKKVNRFKDTEGTLVVETDLIPEKLLTGMHLGPFYMFPKSVTKKIGYFDEQLRSGGDFDFAIRLARSGSVVSTKDLLGWYLDAGLGASTRPNSLQPIERTVIELRYGIFEKMDFSLIPSTFQYSVPNLYFRGKIFPITSVFDSYSDYMKVALSKFNLQKKLIPNSIIYKILERLLRFLKYALKK